MEIDFKTCFNHDIICGQGYYSYNGKEYALLTKIKENLNSITKDFHIIVHYYGDFYLYDKKKLEKLPGTLKIRAELFKRNSSLRYNLAHTFFILFNNADDSLMLKVIKYLDTLKDIEATDESRPYYAWLPNKDATGLNDFKMFQRFIDKMIKHDTKVKNDSNIATYNEILDLLKLVIDSKS